MNSFYLVFGLALAALLGLSFYLSRGVWPYHVEGPRGYIRDMLIYNFAPVGPMVLALIVFMIAQEIDPSLMASSLRYVLMAIGVLGIFFVRRLPPVKAAQARVQAARTARYTTAPEENRS
jgi:hypothetical protein